MACPRRRRVAKPTSSSSSGQQVERRRLGAGGERGRLGEDEPLQQRRHPLLPLAEPVEDREGRRRCHRHLANEAGNGKECDPSITVNRDGLTKVSGRETVQELGVVAVRVTDRALDGRGRDDASDHERRIIDVHEPFELALEEQVTAVDEHAVDLAGIEGRQGRQRRLRSVRLPGRGREARLDDLERVRVADGEDPVSLDVPVRPVPGSADEAVAVAPAERHRHVLRGEVVGAVGVLRARRSRAARR